MNSANYQNFVNTNCKPYVNKPYLVIALAEEVGEISGWYKKVVLKKNKNLKKGKLTKQDLKEECGDVLFYLTRLSKLYGWSLEDIMRANVDKLVGEEKDKQKAVKQDG